MRLLRAADEADHAAVSPGPPFAASAAIRSGSSLLSANYVGSIKTNQETQAHTNKIFRAFVEPCAPSTCQPRWLRLRRYIDVAAAFRSEDLRFPIETRHRQGLRPQDESALAGSEGYRPTRSSFMLGWRDEHKHAWDAALSSPYF